MVAATPKSSSSSDLEKAAPEASPLEGNVDGMIGPTSFWHRVASWGVEARGIAPVTPAEQTDDHYSNIFSLWGSMSVNLLPIVSGMVGTLSFGLSLRDASLVILFFSIICTPAVAYLSILGPKTGLRQMIQARYSFGYYGVSLPVILNLATLVGFCVIASVIGGQTLSAVTGGSMSWDVGIVIIALLGLFLSFTGYRFLHHYERYAWLVMLIAVIIATGCGGNKLHLKATPPPATAASVLSFGGLIAGFIVPYAGIASDFGTYIRPQVSSWRLFTYTYLGLFLPTVPLLVLGAAIGGAVPNVPEWETAYNTGSAGGILAAMLTPAGGFGKFVVVVLAFSTLGNLAGTMYAISLNFQILVPPLVRVPRGVFAVVTTVIVIPVSIKAATSFFESLENFIGIIAYWSSSYVAIVLLEHVYFRSSDPATYIREYFDQPRLLPTGVAAIAAGVGSFGLVIPCMSQIWYTGPIAVHTGDIGFEVAFVVTALLYIPFRTLEIKWLGRR